MGSSSGGGLGQQVGNLGDLNGDGLGEVALSSSSCRGDESCLWIAADLGASLAAAGTTALTTDDLDGVIQGEGGATLGTTIAAAGDVDGDGSSDVLLASRDDDLGSAEVWLFTGIAASGTWELGAVDATATWALSYAGEQAGTECAGGADVDGDGMDDVLIGEPGSSAGAANGGAMLLYLGGSSLQGTLGTGDAWAELYSTTAGARAGAAVALAADVNGDGLGDLVTGLPTLGAAGGATALWWGGARQGD